ncbi:hypothetical protein [Rhizobium sp. SGZ-381]|uniref:hypothetical protein n=1 Tax=Rhizobium sp. SGZ-381 TaxID=3342800 RepID=UPI00366BE10C
MGGLAPLIASLVSMDMRSTVHRLRRNTVLYAIAALFVLTAYGAGVAAFAVYLATMMSIAAALGIVALLALAVALLVFSIVLLKNRADERRRREQAAGNRALMITAAVSALPILLKSRPLAAAAVVSGLALLVTRFMGAGSDNEAEPGA